MPKRSDLDDNSSHTAPPPDYDRDAAAIFAATLSPLSLLLDIMRTRYADRDFDGAIAVARVVVPYVHARLPTAAATQTGTGGELGMMSDADLDAISAHD